MQTYPFDISEALRVGLRNNRNNPINTPAAVECIDGKPYPDGLRGYKYFHEPNPITMFFPQANRVFPFPQLFRGIDNNWLLERDAIYSLSDDFDPTPLSTYDAYDTLTLKSIPAAGEMWQFTDFGNTWIFTSDNAIVFKDNLNFGGSNNILVADDIIIPCISKFRGRVMSGGLKGVLDMSGQYSMVNKSRWDVIMEALRSDMPTEYGDASYTMRDNFILWSSIGSSDLAFRWLLYPEEAETGLISGAGYSSFGFNYAKENIRKTPLFEAIARNEMGFVPMPFGGKIHCIKAIGEEISGIKGAMMVYGAKGVAALIPYSSPVPTFGVRVISNIGVKGRGAVAGDDYLHMWIDNNGCIWQIDASLNAIALGYEEWFENESGFIGSSITSRYEREIYFTNRRKSFHFTQVGEFDKEGRGSLKRGLGQNSQLPTSLINVQGKEYCVEFPQSAKGISFKTDTFTNDTVANKTITLLECSADNNTTLRGAIDWRMSPNDGFSSGEEFILNERGVGTKFTTASQFRIAIRDSNIKNKIHSLLYWWQRPDRRTTRGPDANTLNTRAN